MIRALFIGFAIFCMFLGTCAVVCFRATSSSPQSSPVSTHVDPAPSAYGLRDLLPVRMGQLELLEANVDRWPDPKDRHAIGKYAWATKPGDVPLAKEFRRPTATLSCGATPDEMDGGCLSGKKVALGAFWGCFAPEDKPTDPQAMGAAIIWNDCLLQFVMGGLRGHTKADAIEAATYAAADVASRRKLLR